MSRSSRAGQRGRAAPMMLVLVAAAVLGLLLVLDPLGLFQDPSGGGAGGPGTGADLLGTSATDGMEQAPDAAETATLTTRYGEGDMGAIRARLLWVGTRAPLAGQPVDLRGRRGQEITSLPTDAGGVVVFPQVLPGKGYQLHVAGEGFSELTVQGISVFPQATNDLGDIVLGKDIVLRGRVVDASGRPVPGTSVSVHTIERQLATKGLLVYMAEQASSLPTPLSSVQSDEEGYFAFSALDDGTYSLVARHEGYGSQHESDVLVAGARGAGVLTIVLDDGGLAYGRVTDEAGEPIANAKVIAIRDVRRMTRNFVQREVAWTDEQGRYTIDTLSRGERYRFGVVADGYAPVYEVSGVRVQQEDLEKDFTLVRGGDLQGVVTDVQTGKPVEGARVAVFVGQMGFGGNRDADAKASADVRKTDAKGVFRFEAVTPGPIASAVVQAPGYVSESFSMWPPPGNAWPAIEAGETTEVTVAMKRGGTVRGRVLVEGERTPVQGAEVTLMPTGIQAMIGMWVGTPTTISGADGGYALEGIVPGTYRLVAVAEGFSPSGGAEGTEVVMPEGGGTVEQEVTLITAGVIEGTVTDMQGEPVAGVKVRLREGPTGNEGSGERMRRRMDRMRRMLTGGPQPADLSDAEGRFRLTGVPSGRMWVVYGESAEYVSGETKPLKVSAGETKEVTFEMLPGGSIRGLVVDENGRRMAGVRVQVGRVPDDLLDEPRISSWEARQALGRTAYTTDEEGRFFAPNLEPGPTMVRVTKDGYITHFRRGLRIQPGETVENYTIPMSRGEKVEGIVRGADGRPLERATIALTTDPNPGADGEEAGAGTTEPSDEIEPAMWARTDAQGRYEIGNVRPGTYNLVVWFAPGHKGWMRDRAASAMHRDVRVPGRMPEFRLEPADPEIEGPRRR